MSSAAGAGARFTLVLPVQTAARAKSRLVAPQGVDHAALARAHYLTRGRLFAFGLDSDRDQSSWGRVRVEACIPAGTALQLYAFSADDTDANDPMPGAPNSAEAPALSLAAWALRRPDAQPLFLDPSARPLAPAPADGFAWFDAPVPAGPGRHLWLVFEFAGTRSKSPRLRSVVVDYPGHGLLQQLPRTLWRGQAERFPVQPAHADRRHAG